MAPGSHARIARLMTGSASSRPIGRPRLLAALFFASLLLVATAAGAHAAGRTAAQAGAATPATGAATPPAERAWIHHALSRMNLVEKVGQLFVINAFGTGIHDEDPQMVKLNRQFYGVTDMSGLIGKFRPGGIIYFDWSNKLEDPRKIVGLSNGLQGLARSSHARVPLLISTDQEEGEVTRIGAPATVFPGTWRSGRRAASGSRSGPPGSPAKSSARWASTSTTRRSSTPTSTR